MTDELVNTMIPNQCVKCETEPSFVRHPIAPGKCMDWVMWWRCWECGFESAGTDDYLESINFWNKNNDKTIWEQSREALESGKTQGS